MSLKDSAQSRGAWEQWKPPLGAGLVLFFFSYGMHHLLSRLGIPGASTLLDDFAIALLGASLVYYYLSALALKQNYLRGRERMRLVAELNHHVRNALTIIECSEQLPDVRERQRHVAEAIERIDRVLTELVPTIGSAQEPRFFLSKDSR